MIPSLVININNYCNFSCIYCPPYGENLFSSEATEYDINAVKVIIRTMASNGCKLLRFTGGEPLLEFTRLYQLLKFSNGMFKRTILNTNGYHLMDYLNDLIEFKSFLTIKVSLDSLNSDTLKGITGVDCLDKVLLALNTAIDMGFQVEINCVLLGQSIDDVISVIEFAKAKSIVIKLLTVSGFYGNVKTISCDNLPEIMDYLDKHSLDKHSECLPSGMGISMITYEFDNSKVLIVDHRTSNSVTPDRFYFSSCMENCQSYPCECGAFSSTVTVGGVFTPCRGHPELGESVFFKSDFEIQNAVHKVLSFFDARNIIKAYGGRCNDK